MTKFTANSRNHQPSPHSPLSPTDRRVGQDTWQAIENGASAEHPQPASAPAPTPVITRAELIARLLGRNSRTK